MSIDIFFHSRVGSDIANQKISIFLGEDKLYFPIDFLVYDAKPSNDVNKDIASEFGFNSESKFVISLNNKSRADEISSMVKFVKEYFDSEDLLILFQNESLIS